MFYYKNWDRFCNEVSKFDIEFLRVRDLLESRRTQQFIVFKHDVETNVKNALKLAKIENKYGIKGSFYVQAFLLDNDSNIQILKEIQRLGHEVSYHYDVLDKNEGNIVKAKIDFQNNLENFKNSGFDIVTVCQHGNPIKNRVGYTSNRDFFRNKNISQQYKNIVDVVVNLKEKTGADYLYISDAGYSWKLISDPENNDKNNDTNDFPLKNFGNIKKMLLSGNSIILSTHPHRWKKSFLSIFFRIVLFKIIRSLFRTISKISFLKKILNKFYFLAKNI